jgi:hypothetical protein
MKLLVIPAVVAAVLGGLACSITDPLTLLGCQFRIESTEDFVVAGINLDSLGSLSPFQIAEVVAAWSQGNCPVDFTLNVGIFNPNDGSGSSTVIPVSLSSFLWDLYLDGDSGIPFDTTWVASGALNEPFEVPGSGETIVLPLEISFDAFVLLEELGPLEFIDLALAIGGLDSGLRDPDHLGRILVVAEPTLTTPFGPYTYPGSLFINLDWVN